MARIFYKAGARKRPAREWRLRGGRARLLLSFLDSFSALAAATSERASERAYAARETISSLYLGKHIVCTHDDVSRILEVNA